MVLWWQIGDSIDIRRSLFHHIDLYLKRKKMHQLPAEIKSCNVVVPAGEAFLGQQKQLNHKQGHGICMLEDNKSKPWLFCVYVR